MTTGETMDKVTKLHNKTGKKWAHIQAQWLRGDIKEWRKLTDRTHSHGNVSGWC